MHRGKAPPRQGRLQKLTRNSDIVHNTSLANSFLREERNLDKKLQNLNAEKRLSLAKMDSEIKFYRKMNKNKIGKWEDNCDMSDVSEAGSDENEDVHVGYKASFYDSNFKSKTVQYSKGNNTSVANDYPSKYGSSFSRFTPFGSSKQIDTSKQFYHSLLCESYSDPSWIEKSFSRDIPHHFETKNLDGSTTPHLASGRQKQKAKEFEDFNPRNRSISIRHAGYTGFLHGENQIGGLPHYTGDQQATGLSDQHATGLGGHQGIGMGGHQARRLSYHIGGHQTNGLSHHTGGHQTGSVFHHMGDLQASGLAPQMGGRHAAVLPHPMVSHHTTGSFDQTTGMSQFNGPAIGQLSHLANGIPTTTGGGHKSIVRIRKLVHAEHHSGEPGSHKPYGINLGPGDFEAGAGEASRGINHHEVVGMHSHEPHIKANKLSDFPVSKFKSSVLGSKSLEKSGTSAIPAHDSPSLTTSFRGPHLRHNSIAPSAHNLPKQQSNTTYDWVFQNSPPKHLGISIHNPMLFHPRFHNNLGLVDAPEEHTESTDPNSIHVLRKCRYLRIPKPLCHDPGVDHAWCI